MALFWVISHGMTHEVKLPLARPLCPAMAGRRRAAEPAGVVPNTAPRWQAQKWSGSSRYAFPQGPPRPSPFQLPTVLRLFCRRTGTAAGVGSAGAAVSTSSATDCCCHRRRRRECRSPAPSAVDGTSLVSLVVGRPFAVVFFRPSK